MPTDLISFNNFIYTVIGGIFATGATYLASRALRRSESEHQERLARSEAETKRLDLLIEGQDRYSQNLRARIEQQDHEITALRDDYWKAFANANRLKKDLDSCQETNRGLVERVATLELRVKYIQGQ